VRYTIVYTKQSAAELLALPAKVQRQIKAKIERLVHGFTGDIKKLHATENIYRLRSGDFRIIFEVEGASVIVILTIRNRKDGYE
jgi:mRNA interferase RelE/StbE